MRSSLLLATHRSLSYTRRETLTALTGERDTPVAELESRLRQPLPAALQEARTELRELARQVELDLIINQTVVR